MDEKKVARLVAAWLEWERPTVNPPDHPSALWLADQSHRKESAMKALTSTPRLLHMAIVAGRRAGLGVEESVRSALHELNGKELDEVVQEEATD